MTTKEKNYICQLRDKGLSYSKIAEQTGFSESTIKSFLEEKIYETTMKRKSTRSANIVVKS